MNIECNDLLRGDGHRPSGRPVTVLAVAMLLVQGCGPPDAGQPQVSQVTTTTEAAPIAPLRVSGSYWIELSPILVAAENFSAQKLGVGEGGIVRIIMMVTEGFYRLVARRSAGITTLADLKGKRVMVPRLTSAHYYVVAMLRTAGLSETDIELVSLPPAVGSETGMDQMSEALARGDADAISIWEPEPADAVRRLGDDAIVFQDRSVYREVFNLHARAPDLADPVKRRAIGAFVRAVADATAALETEPERYWPHVSSITGFTLEEIGWGWPELEFPVRIVPDMLDVLEVEERWVAAASNRARRSRTEFAQFIDSSVLAEALAGR